MTLWRWFMTWNDMSHDLWREMTWVMIYGDKSHESWVRHNSWLWQITRIITTTSADKSHESWKSFPGSCIAWSHSSAADTFQGKAKPGNITKSTSQKIKEVFFDSFIGPMEISMLNLWILKFVCTPSALSHQGVVLFSHWGELQMTRKQHLVMKLPTLFIGISMWMTTWTQLIVSRMVRSYSVQREKCAHPAVSTYRSLFPTAPSWMHKFLLSAWHHP